MNEIDGARGRANPDFELAVCAEMVFLELPFEERVRRISGLGFQVEIWDWTRHDIGALARTQAEFSSMTGYIRGTLADEDGAEELIRTAQESIRVAGQLGCPKLNLHGTGLDNNGKAVRPWYGALPGPCGYVHIALCHSWLRPANAPE